MKLAFTNRFAHCLLAATMAALTVPAIGQAPDIDLKNTPIGELFGRDPATILPEAKFTTFPVDPQCASFPFRNNGADVSAFAPRRPASQLRAEDHKLLMEDYRVLLSVREQAWVVAEPDVAIGASLEVVKDSQTTFGIPSEQFEEAVGFHGDLLLENFHYEAARNHIAAAVFSSCRTAGADSTQTIAKLDSLAHATELLGDTLTSARLLSDLADRIQKTKGSDHPDTIAVRERYALALADLNRSDEAEAVLRQTLAAARISFASNEIGLINSINNYAFMLGTNGKLEKAIPLHAEVVEKNKAHFEKGHSRHIAGIGNLAIALLKAGRTEEAAPLIAEQMRLVRTSEQPSVYEIAVALLNRADLATAEQRFSEAREDQKLAVEIYEKIYGEDHPVTRRALQKLWRTLLQLQDETALNIAEKAVAHANNRRNALGFRVGSTLHRERNLASESEVQTLYLDSLWIAEKRESFSVKSKAFAALQRALQSPISRAFGGAAARRTAAARSSRLGELVDQREALSRNWETAELERIQLLSGGPSKSTVALVEKSQLQRELAVRMSTIDDQLQNEAPDFFELLRPEPVGTTTTAGLFRPNEAALLLRPGEFGTHIMLITATGVNWHRSDWSRDRIDAAVQRLLFDAGSSIKVPDNIQERWDDEGRGYLSYDRKLAHEVYRELVAPFSQDLEGISQIFTIAGGSLSSLPFAILVSELPSNGDDANASNLRQTQWMIDDFALATLPSLQSLSQSRARKTISVRPGRKRFIGFGDPVLDGPRASRSIKPEGSSTASLEPGAVFGVEKNDANNLVKINEVRKLTRLPGTAVELRMLSTLLGPDEGTLYLADKATEPAFREADLDAEIVVLATHGLLAGELDFLTEPALVMTPPQTVLPGDDGLLTASEVTRLRINAEWVVLSACNTAASDGREGAPGLSGLAQAFFYAGTKNMLVSHWPVRDDVAARITVRAIELEQTGEAESRANALRQAILELRADTSLDDSDDHLAHPYAWAPFILVGDSQ